MYSSLSQFQFSQFYMEIKKLVKDKEFANVLLGSHWRQLIKTTKQKQKIQVQILNWSTRLDFFSSI